MDIRKLNIQYISGCENHECIEIDRHSDTEIVMVDKEVKLMEECIVDIYKQLEKFDLRSMDKLKSKLKILESKIIVLEQIGKDDNSTLIN
jgi:hypothetical protein